MKTLQRALNDEALVSKTPIATFVLLESARIGHVMEMIQNRSAGGQSLGSLLLIGFSLALWYNFYRVFNPNQVWAKRTTLVGIGMNTLMLLIAAWFKLVPESVQNTFYGYF